MESSSLCDSLLKWLETFPGRAGIAVPHLTDGVVMANVLHQIAPEYFSQFWLAKIKADVGDNWRLKVSNLRKVLQGIVDYYQEQLNQNIKHFPLPDLNKIGEHGESEEMGRMLQLILGCAVNCENKQQYIEAIMNMEERVQKVIMEAIQELMLRESSPGILSGDSEARPDLGPASFHPHIKTILEQLEAATQSRDETVQRCHELEQQISVINEEKTALSTENEKLLSRLDAWETGGDLGTSTLRYKDLKKQIDGLQDELYKLETSRDEYRTKADMLERENQEIQTRNEELQRLADEARSLKDEVDALREMSERAVVYEGTMETYKKKLEELSDLKRQVRILEEKNSDYMQHNMELEEEVKKSGTWRPQLDLYKKQVAELHQKLADEAKKTDRQVFENKKLTEKMEAVMQEKDRLTKERDALKENIEEMKCHISTLTSDTASRPPSDLSDVDLLEVVPHEIREKLMRLQHENSMLKQRAAEGGSSEQLPVLQTLVSDLQDRQNSLTQENRWDSKGDLGYPRPNQRGESITPPTVPSFSYLDAYINVDPSKKMKLFKRNLKWASESDLLILRQPKGLLSANFLTSTLPFQPPRSLPPLPVSSSSFATQTNKESPIVIRHIHEFKLSPSPTNEDSGCCRTSPSSCEGCEDTGCTESHSPDYNGTLDSGISGIYSGTLESGMSGAYRCLSPVIPSIVEECTTHHMTDILPALGAHRMSSPSVMHHSHPAHTSCLHCCSHTSQGEENGEGSGKEVGRTHCASPAPPPRPHTVCSYNPPYKYNHGASPTPTSPLRQLPVSPPLSPHINCSSSSVIPLSTLYLPSTMVDLSFVHTQSVKTSLSKPAVEGILNFSPQVSLTSLAPSSTCTSANPLPVSSPQGRRTGGGFARSSLPPESPTPHNSPRLPNSINATRNRSCKNSSSTVVLNEAASNIKEIPVTQTILVGRASSPDKGQRSHQEKSNLNEEKGNGKNLLGNSLISSESHTPSPHKSNVIAKEGYQTVCSNNTPQSQEKDASNIGRKTREMDNKHGIGISSLSSERREIKVKNERSSDPQTLGNNSLTKDKSDGKTVTFAKTSTSYTSKFNKDSKPVADYAKDFRTCSYSGLKYASNVKSFSGATSVTGFNSAHTPVTSRVVNTRENNQSPKSNLSSKSSSAVACTKNPISVPHVKSNNHVKFSEPVVSQVTQNESETVPGHYSPVSPRERMSSFPKTTASKTTYVKSQESSKSKKNTSNVTLLSDTLFTHFELSSEPQNRKSEKDGVLSATDTDTDLETLERKLTLGMYAAPLVSSESCTSVSPDDADEDPSATDYCTDNASDMGEYNPRQFKPYIDEDCVKINHNNIEVQRAPEEQKISEAINVETDDAESLVRTYSFFRRQSKAKKQKKIAAKETSPSVNGGVIKPKHKAAKHVVAETINAMFTLCTP